HGVGAVLLRLVRPALVGGGRRPGLDPGDEQRVVAAGGVGDGAGDPVPHRVLVVVELGEVTGARVDVGGEGEPVDVPQRHVVVAAVPGEQRVQPVEGEAAAGCVGVGVALVQGVAVDGAAHQVGEGDVRLFVDGPAVVGADGRAVLRHGGVPVERHLLGRVGRLEGDHRRPVRHHHHVAFQRVPDAAVEAGGPVARDVAVAVQVLDAEVGGGPQQVLVGRLQAVVDGFVEAVGPVGVGAEPRVLGRLEDGRGDRKADGRGAREVVVDLVVV